MELRRVGTGPEVIMAYHGPAAAHPDAAALQVLAAMMSGAAAADAGDAAAVAGAATAGSPRRWWIPRRPQSASMRFELRHDPGLITVTATLDAGSIAR